MSLLQQNKALKIYIYWSKHPKKILLIVVAAQFLLARSYVPLYSYILCLATTIKKTIEDMLYINA